MTVLFDVTIQHAGWFGGTFANGGWQESWPPSVSGLSARSYFAQAINGNAMDQAAGFGVLGNPSPTHPYWFNVHTNGALSGATNPSPFLVTPDTRLITYTRVPRASDQILWRITVSDQAVTGPPTRPACEYGTQPQTGAAAVVYLTQPIIDATLTAVGHPELGILFAPLIGIAYAVNLLCADQPPQWRALSGNPNENTFATLLNDFKAVTWPYFCQCTPGTPSPIDFPPASVVVTGPLPTATVWPCDPVDMCNNIVAILTQIGLLQQNVASYGQLTTLMQRYLLPFAVVPGAGHLARTGTGSFQVSRLIGVGIDIVAPDPPSISLPGAPTYIKNLGWMGIATLGGYMLAERRVARAHEIWLPAQMAEAAVFNYQLNDGVVADIRELQAET